jgi:cupin 2 domain-containing protein
MAEQDLLLFLDKVAQLQKLVNCLETDQERRQSLAGCSDHNQVVTLARSWGFEIGRRWGEPPSPTGDGPGPDNIFRGPLPAAGHDHAELLAEGAVWRLMLISSNASCAGEHEWIDPSGSLWMLLLRGSARLQLGDPEELTDLSAGDHLMIQHRRPYRLLRTDPPPGTLRLELHWRA